MNANQETTTSGNMSNPNEYAARLEVDYPEKLDRLTTFFRIIWIIPIAIILGLLTAAGETVTHTVYLNQAGEVIRSTRDTAGGLVSGIGTATALMILFRQRYPRWWFDFSRELTRFGYRVGAYAALITDQYPSTVEEQSVHLEIDYPDAKNDLNRWMPIFKWFLAIPHYIVLAFLAVGAVFAWIIAWFAILFTGQYPKGLFDYMVGVGRWGLRVDAYAVLMVTDQYPPFSLQ
jgi:mannose/fructose/N-acetylgalactosamine-specific phosphotransferase system component IIC